MAVREDSQAPWHAHHITVIIKGIYIKGEIKNNEPDKCEKLEWFDLNDLPRPLFSGVAKTLENYKTKKMRVVSEWNR